MVYITVPFYISLQVQLSLRLDSYAAEISMSLWMYWENTNDYLVSNAIDECDDIVLPQ